MKNTMRSYSHSELWLEQQMKEFWVQTRGKPPTTITLNLFLSFWNDTDKIQWLERADKEILNKEWIGILFERVSYLISGKTQE